jgi:hypothetical protein
LTAIRLQSCGDSQILRFQNSAILRIRQYFNLTLFLASKIRVARFAPRLHYFKAYPFLSLLHQVKPKPNEKKNKPDKNDFHRKQEV